MHQEPISDKCFASYAQTIHKMMGITIDENRKAMLEGRVRQRLRRLDVDTYEDYLSFLKDNKDEEENFINVITTNETYFYRTPRVWDFIEKEFLTALFNEKKKRKAKIWSAASSTGEEAHTLGIICESFKNDHPGFSYDILGTDINSSVVQTATEGKYIGRPVRRFSETRPELFKKYMQGDDKAGFSVLPTIKTNIQFKLHNLFDAYRSADKFDLIMLRNVLIYFDKSDQEKVLANMHRALSSDGFLIIGESESLTRIDSDFEPEAPMIYRPRAGKIHVK